MDESTNKSLCFWFLSKRWLYDYVYTAHNWEYFGNLLILASWLFSQLLCTCTCCTHRYACSWGLLHLSLVTAAWLTNVSWPLYICTSFLQVYSDPKDGVHSAKSFTILRLCSIYKPAYIQESASVKCVTVYIGTAVSFTILYIFAYIWRIRKIYAWVVYFKQR